VTAVSPTATDRGAEHDPGSAPLVALLIPVLNRPRRVKPLLKSIDESTQQGYRVLFLGDPDDQAELDAVEATGADFIDCGGTYPQKINIGVRLTQEPLIFTGADDLAFHPGWLEAATAKLRRGVHVVGTNDLGNPTVMRGEHSTHCLVTREYTKRGTVDEPGRLLHEGYNHNFCDNELVETAKARGVWDFAKDSHVEHLHPFWDKGKADRTYIKGQETFMIDRKLFHKRRQLWQR
jgi:hypothetical protein